LCDGISGQDFCACAGQAAQDAVVASTTAAAAAAVFLNEWSHRSVRTFIIIIIKKYKIAEGRVGRTRRMSFTTAPKCSHTRHCKHFIFRFVVKTYRKRAMTQASSMGSILTTVFDIK